MKPVDGLGDVSTGHAASAASPCKVLATRQALRPGQQEFWGLGVGPSSLSTCVCKACATLARGKPSHDQAGPAGPTQRRDDQGRPGLVTGEVMRDCSRAYRKLNFSRYPNPIHFNVNYKARVHSWGRGQFFR